jgi:tripartite-type tricarboxylate transporter receptor subunit TctC
MRSARRLICAGLLATISATAGSAQEPFYKGKQIRIVISAGVSGGYNEYARLLATHMGNHIPGKPDFIVQSMPGAGGLLATNYLYAQAPQDGTTLGLIHSSVPLAPLFGTQGARFEAQKFHWIGSMDRSDGPCTAWHTSPAKTWADLLQTPFIVGSSGVGSQMDIYPAMLNKLFGTKIKVIAGYKDGVAVYIAMERGELDGRCGGQLTVIKSTRPHWLTERKIAVPVLIAQKRSPEFPDTPTVMEFVKDEPTRQQLDLVMLTQGLDRPVMLPPGVPAERVRELRAAFDATMADSAFRAEPEPACRSGPRGGDGQSVRARLCAAAGSHCWRT